LFVHTAQWVIEGVMFVRSVRNCCLELDRPDAEAGAAKLVRATLSAAAADRTLRAVVT
jgi:hypothetical protein